MLTEDGRLVDLASYPITEYSDGKWGPVSKGTLGDILEGRELSEEEVASFLSSSLTSSLKSGS